MIVFNSLLFLTFCLAGLYLLFYEGRMIQNPFIKEQKYFATGHQIFLLLTMATGMFMLGDYSATRLLIWTAYLFIGVVITKGEIKFTMTIIFYIFYILYLIFSLFVFSFDKWYGSRVIAKYLFPFFILLFAAKITNSEFVVHSATKYILAIAVFLEISFILWLPWIRLFWPTSAFGDHLVIVCAITLALFFATSKKKYMWLISFFFVYFVYFVIRTGIIGVTVCFSVFFIFKYKWKAMPVIVLVIVAAVLVVLYVPSVREKMFRKQMTADEILENREEMSIKDIDTNGRQAMWDWSLANFYQQNKIFGSGVGNLQKTFYSGQHPFGGLMVVHNDFIQILCDTGLIGLILYLLIGLSLVVHTFYIYNDKRNNEMIKFCAIVAGSSMVGILCTSYTDNSVNYSFATYCYPFAFYGMALSLLQKYGR